MHLKSQLLTPLFEWRTIARTVNGAATHIRRHAEYEAPLPWRCFREILKMQDVYLIVDDRGDSDAHGTTANNPTVNDRTLY